MTTPREGLVPRVDELELLSRLLDGDLPPDEAARVRAQMATRPELAQAYARLQRLESLTSELGQDLLAEPTARDVALVERVLHRPSPMRWIWPVALAAGA